MLLQLDSLGWPSCWRDMCLSDIISYDTKIYHIQSSKAVFERLTKNFQLRDVSKQAKLGMPSSCIYREASALRINKKGSYPSYRASRNDILLRLNESGFIKDIVDTAAPDAVVLFGSASRGEDIEGSDVDLLIVAKEVSFNIEKYETILQRNMHLLFEPDLKKLTKELLNNIINGIVVYGYLKAL